MYIWLPRYMWERLSTCVMTNPWGTIPMYSEADLLVVSIFSGVLSQPSPLSMVYCWGGTRASMEFSATMGRDNVTLRPFLTRPKAPIRFSGVIRLSVPIWSSFPQRPQLLREVNQPLISSDVGFVLAISSYFRFTL